MSGDQYPKRARGPQDNPVGDEPRDWLTEPPVTLEDTQPTRVPSPDNVETGELPGTLGEPTVARDRVPTGATPTARLPRPVPPPQRPGFVPAHHPQPPGDAQRAGGRRAPQRGRALLRVGFVAVFTLVLMFFLAAGAIVVGYVAIANQLPSPRELQTRQTVFVSSKIFDREGHLLYEVTDPQGGRRTYVAMG